MAGLQREAALYRHLAGRRVAHAQLRVGQHQPGHEILRAMAHGRAQLQQLARAVGGHVPSLNRASSSA